MNGDQTKVSVPSGPFSFPSLCSKCLGETDLTSYRNLTSYKAIYKQGKIEIPICHSCKKKLRKEARLGSLGTFVISFLLFGGILYFLGAVFFQRLFVFDWKIAIVFLVVLVGIPLGFAYGIIKPEFYLREQSIADKDPQWPVKFERFRPDEDLKRRNPLHYEKLRQEIVLSFENEDYAKLFVAAIPNLRIISLERMGLSIDQHTRRLQHASSSVREKAVKALGKTKDPKAVEPLIQALQDEQSLVRQYAAVALGDIGDARAIEALTQAKEDKSWGVRVSVNSALKIIKRKQTQH